MSTVFRDDDTNVIMTSETNIDMYRDDGPLVIFCCDYDITFTGIFKRRIGFHTNNNITVSFIGLTTHDSTVHIKSSEPVNIFIRNCSINTIYVDGTVNNICSRDANLSLVCSKLASVDDKSLPIKCDVHVMIGSGVGIHTLCTSYSVYDEYHEDAFNATNLVLCISSLMPVDLSRFNFDKVKTIKLNCSVPITFNDDAFKITTSWISKIIKGFKYPYMPNLKKMEITKCSYDIISTRNKLDDMFNEQMKNYTDIKLTLSARDFRELKLIKPSKAEYVTSTIISAIYSNCELFENVALPGLVISVAKTPINMNKLIRLIDGRSSDIKSARKV
jgi:hypothetical protein